jgi:DNA-binding transcriptional LysR family regulator
MLLRQLEYLTALAREEHFGRAASACHVSQPALSAAIRKLEAELGVAIVRRGQRFEGFTAEGVEVLRWARRICAEQDGMRQALSGMRGQLTGSLRIGAIPTALSIASLLTVPMRESHPLVRFSFSSMTSREIVTRLNDFDIDVGMTYVDGEPLGRARLIPLYRERHLFLTPATEGIGDRNTISWAEAAEHPLCLLDPSMQNRRIIDSKFSEAGASPRAEVVTDTVSAVYDHVASLQFSSVVPHAWVHLFGVPDGTRLLELPQSGRAFHVGLALAGSHPESLLAKAFVTVAQEADLGGQLTQSIKRHLIGHR